MVTSAGRKLPIGLLFVAGPLISLSATVMGYLVPVGPRCSGAFASDHGETNVSYETACALVAQTSRVAYFAFIACGVAIVIFGIVVRNMRPEPSNLFSGSDDAAHQAGRRVQGVSKRRLTWPFIVGPLIGVAGIVLGYTTPVGRECSGAFASDHPAAVGYDIAYAMSGAGRSYLSDACTAAAPGQRGIYFGIIGFGVAVVILGVVLRSVASRKPDVTTARPAVSVADELERLDGLRIRGILSDAEFEAEKRLLLRR